MKINLKSTNAKEVEDVQKQLKRLIRKKRYRRRVNVNSVQERYEKEITEVQEILKDLTKSDRLLCDYSLPSPSLPACLCICS